MFVLNLSKRELITSETFDLTKRVDEIVNFDDYAQKIFDIQLLILYNSSIVS